MRVTQIEMKYAFFLIVFTFCLSHRIFCEDFVFTGEIEGKVKVSVTSLEWGGILWLIENGSPVKKGDVVAKMETRRVDEHLEAKKDEIDRLKEELNANKKELEETDKNEDVNISQVTLERDLAKVKWEIEKSGIYGIELSRLQSEIINSEIELEKKKFEYTTSKKLFEKQLEEEQSYQQAKLDLELAEINLSVKKNNLEIKIKEKSDSEKISKLELEAKELQLQKAIKNKLNITQKIRFEIEKKEEGIINLNDNIKKNETRVKNLILLAPSDGIAKYRINNGKLVQIGDRIGRGFAIIDILYSEQKKIIVLIEEKHILKFSLNDKAKIKLLDTGEIFEGSISRISNSPKDKNENLGPVGRRVSGFSGITVFEVELSFDDPAFKFKYGFKAQVTFSK